MKKKNNMFGYKVKISSRRDFYEHDGKLYGAWSASSSHTLIKTVEMTEDYPDVVAPFDLKTGDDAYVVWVIWSSGDSFGHESGAFAEAIGIFKDAKAAFELSNHIERTDWRKINTLKLTTSDGQQFNTGWVPWSGYFESLDSVQVDAVLVNNGD